MPQEPRPSVITLTHVIWFGLLWVTLCLIFVVATLGGGLLIAWLPLGLVGLWFIYRVARGWLRLLDHRPMFA